MSEATIHSIAAAAARAKSPRVGGDGVTAEIVPFRKRPVALDQWLPRTADNRLVYERLMQEPATAERAQLLRILRLIDDNEARQERRGFRPPGVPAPLEPLVQGPQPARPPRKPRPPKNGRS